MGEKRDLVTYLTFINNSRVPIDDSGSRTKPGRPAAKDPRNSASSHHRLHNVDNDDRQPVIGQCDRPIVHHVEARPMRPTTWWADHDLRADSVLLQGNTAWEKASVTLIAAGHGKRAGS